MELSLAGAKVLVSGGTRGIGRSIVEAFLAEGAEVAFCARTERDVESAEDELRRTGAKAHGAVLDAGDHAAVVAWVEGAVRRWEGIDILIPNVSAQSEDWERALSVDVNATRVLVDACLPHLVRSRRAAIVAISSQAALRAVPSYAAYSAAKAALVSYMGSLAVGLGRHGVRVNSVSPSEVYFRGGFWERMEREDPELVRATLARQALGRMATPGEVANVVVFLASAAASYVSGANVLVDGASRDFVQF